MTSATAAHSTNGSTRHLAAPELDSIRNALIEKLQRGVPEDAEQLAKLFKDVVRPQMEGLTRQLPVLELDCQEEQFSGPKGTANLRIAIVERLTQLLFPDPHASPKDGASPVNGSSIVADKAGDETEDRTMLPALSGNEQVVRELRASRERSAREVNLLAEELARSDAQNSQVAEEAAAAHLGIQESNSEALGVLAAAFVHGQQQTANMLKRIARETDQGGAIRRGGAKFFAAIEERRDASFRTIQETTDDDTAES